MKSIPKATLKGVLPLVAELPDVVLCPGCLKVPVEPIPVQLPGTDPDQVVRGPTRWAIPVCDACAGAANAAFAPMATVAGRLKAAGLDGRLLTLTLAGWEIGGHVDLPTNLAYTAARKFIDRPERNLWLFGKTGTGKTHLAAAIIREMVDRRVPAYFAYAPALVDMLRDLQFQDADYRATMASSKPVRTEVLALDDFGVQRRTPFTDEVLDYLVNERYVGGRPTIVTSNLSPDEAAQGFSDRIVSRLMENAVVVDFGDEDWRLKHRKGVK